MYNDLRLSVYISLNLIIDFVFDDKTSTSPTNRLITVFLYAYFAHFAHINILHMIRYQTSPASCAMAQNTPSVSARSVFGESNSLINPASNTITLNKT